ncbi:MAG: SAM-dependent methyltransferase [Candidatus Bathyarchaeia archaeon]|jgi:predicted RNA methylase|nr:class I SAM-dependent methyltransferase [Candidatus Bathyarchaeota archaeon A05DMB-4]MDH7595551.1 class I SAM-dependent methyltransferase [Candidatus Bathyarchaeota archaeon]
MFIAPFVASPLPVIRHMLELAELKHNETFFDLGAGDGRTVIMAAQDFGARAVGVELRDDLVKKALTSIRELGLQDRVTIVQGDMFTVDLRAADVVFLYLTTSANEKIKTKLESELKNGARVVSHDYEIIGWKPYKIDNFCENPKLGYPSHTIYAYKKQ